MRDSLTPITRDPEAAAPLSIAEVMDQVAAGAAGPILTALARQPLRTKHLMEQLSSYAPRTVYRHTSKLAALGLVEQEETAGAPVTLRYRLSSGGGRELYQLLDAYAEVALPRAERGNSEGELWRQLRLLAEMWGSGWIGELSLGSRRPTELAETTTGLTFHQVNRRLRLLRTHGLVHISESRGRGTRYQLDDRARRGTALIAGLARWRQRYLLQPGERALTATEMTPLVRASLPLIQFPSGVECRIRVGIAGLAEGDGGARAEAVLVSRGADGRVRCAENPDDEAEAWALGSVDAWLALILDGKCRRVRTGGDRRLAKELLARLHPALWANEKGRRKA